MPNEWIIALKKWNTGKETWCLPKKGSKAYDEVRALMPEKKLKASAEPEKAPEPAPAMSEPSKSKGPKIAPKKPIRGDVAPPAPPMKIPMEPQRKAFSDSMAPKVKFVEPAKKAEQPGKKLMDQIKELVEEAKENARKGASAEELTDFYNKKIGPKISLYGAEYLGSGGASEIADELFEEISAEYRKKQASLPKVEPPRRKTDREYHIEEVAEALPKIKSLVGDKPLMKLSKAVLLEIVNLGHNKIGRFNLPDIHKNWYYSTGTSVYSKMTGAKKEDIIKHIQLLPLLTRNVFPKLS